MCKNVNIVSHKYMCHMWFHSTSWIRCGKTNCHGSYWPSIDRHKPLISVKDGQLLHVKCRSIHIDQKDIQVTKRCNERFILAAFKSTLPSQVPELSLSLWIKTFHWQQEWYQNCNRFNQHGNHINMWTFVLGNQTILKFSPSINKYLMQKTSPLA